MISHSGGSRGGIGDTAPQPVFLNNFVLLKTKLQKKTIDIFWKLFLVPPPNHISGATPIVTPHYTHSHTSLTGHGVYKILPESDS